MLADWSHAFSDQSSHPESPKLKVIGEVLWTADFKTSLAGKG